MEENFSVINQTKGKLPGLPFQLIKEDILGKNYSLSIAFISKAKSKELNNAYRKKIILPIFYLSLYQKMKVKY